MNDITIRVEDGSSFQTTGGETASLDEVHVRGLDGERLTDDNIDEEIRAIATRLGSRGGRPRVAEGERTVGISFKVPVSIRDAVQHRAQTDGVRQSDVLCAALEEYLETA
ncbi:hypothetical protein [uncultured Tessaracoccus sp.]|uniref:hypothetical protein n=1 Tax=uncultured Tessaracoccus sp. TaxID=905023 RepID=UPI0026285CBF|nr:hypothetical protein [uncultured Tessaracoccus sp.]